MMYGVLLRFSPTTAGLAFFPMYHLAAIGRPLRIRQQRDLAKSSDIFEGGSTDSGYRRSGHFVGFRLDYRDVVFRYFIAKGLVGNLELKLWLVVCRTGPSVSGV
jgi:hypothetical protein